MPKISPLGLCLWMLPARILLDLLWWIAPLGFSLSSLCSALFAVILALSLLAGASRGEAPLGPFARGAAWLLLASFLVAALRAESPFDVLRYGIQAAMPPLWVAAMRLREPQWPEAWTLAALLPIALSLGLLLAGQPAEHVLHGWPRLVGGYGNLHGHAAAMAVFVATLGPIAALQRSKIAAVAAANAAICLGATFVRGGWLWVLLAIGLWLIASGRVSRALMLAAGSLLALGSVAILRDRLSDLLALLSGSPPEGGWEALGSWRVRIWTDSLGRFLEGSALDVLFGRGFGGHLGLHRHLDPHSDWLSILYQLGISGLLLALVCNAALLVALWRRRAEPLASLALGVLSAALLVALVSNDLLFRPTALWWTYGLVGAALGIRREGTGAPLPLAPAASTGPLRATERGGSASRGPSLPHASRAPRPTDSPGR